jgi:hypothetical protein
MTVSIGDLTVAAARGDEELLERLAMMTGLSLRKVAKRLLSLDGRTRLRNVFAAELPLSRESLGVLSVKQARDWQLVPEIARAWSLPSARVEEILESVHGRTLVRRAFDDEETASEDEDEVNDFLNRNGERRGPGGRSGRPAGRYRGRLVPTEGPRRCAPGPRARRPRSPSLFALPERPGLASEPGGRGLSRGRSRLRRARCRRVIPRNRHEGAPPAGGLRRVRRAGRKHRPPIGRSLRPDGADSDPSARF